MPQIRVPRKRDDAARSIYVDDHDETYAERMRERGKADFERTLGRLIGLGIVILVLVIFAIVSAMSSSSSGTRQISAADTYAVSAQAQAEMKDTMEDFITGIILLSYSSDEAAASEGKALALSTMAQGTDSYSLVSAMGWEGGMLPPESLGVVIGGISMDSGTRAYAGTYTYTGRGGAADLSATDEENPDGQLVDRGLSFTVSFRQVTDQDGRDPKWKISYARIVPT